MMKKIVLTLMAALALVSASSCKGKVDPVGTWYCPENNVLLTFYEDQSFDRKMIGFDSSYDGTYQWMIDSENLLKVSDLTGATIQTYQWDQKESADDTWYLKDALVIGDHHYRNTEGNEITENDISPDFLENHANCLCTVFMEEDSNHSFRELQNTLSAMEDVKSVEYVSSDEAWKRFQEDYFGGNEDAAEGFADDNPLQNSSHLEIYAYTEAGMERIISYLETLDYVGQINKSALTVKDDSFL